MKFCSWRRYESTSSAACSTSFRKHARLAGVPRVGRAQLALAPTATSRRVSKLPKPHWNVREHVAEAQHAREVLVDAAAPQRLLAVDAVRLAAGDEARGAHAVAADVEQRAAVDLAHEADVARPRSSE